MSYEWAAHNLSEWASCYGLPNPIPLAENILGLHPHTIAAMARWTGIVTERVGDAAHIAGRAALLLDASWSNRAGFERAALLARSMGSMAQDAAVVERAAEVFRETIAEAQYAVNETLAKVTFQLGGDPALAGTDFPPDGVEVLSKRVFLVETTATQVFRSEAIVLGAARALLTALPDDPRRLTPPHWSLVDSEAAGHLRDTQAALLGALQRDLKSPSERRRLFAEGVLRGLRAAADTGAPVYLLAYDPDEPEGQGSAAIALGDLQTADNVSVVVPGVRSSPANMAAVLDEVDTLRTACDQAAPGTTTATVLWMGYDIPLSRLQEPPEGNPLGDALDAIDDALKALDASAATEGGQRLAEFCSELRTMIPSAASLTLAGFSYGAAVTSQAARVMKPDARVTDIISAASPGAGAHVSSADDYPHIDASHVYSLSYDGDPITSDVMDIAAGIGLLGTKGPLALALALVNGHGSPFGTDPDDPDFGGNHINADSPIQDGTFDKHSLSNYLDGDGLDAITAIITGQYSKVPLIDPVP